MDRPEPGITAPDEVKLRVLEVGVCGTGREEAAGGRAHAAEGHSDLVIGHEMLGEVVVPCKMLRPAGLAAEARAHGSPHRAEAVIEGHAGEEIKAVVKWGAGFTLS